jgi:hypothetical protein
MEAIILLTELQVDQAVVVVTLLELEVLAQLDKVMQVVMEVQLLLQVAEEEVLVEQV